MVINFEKLPKKEQEKLTTMNERALQKEKSSAETQPPRFAYTDDQGVLQRTDSLKEARKVKNRTAHQIDDASNVTS